MLIFAQFASHFRPLGSSTLVRHRNRESTKAKQSKSKLVIDWIVVPKHHHHLFLKSHFDSNKQFFIIQNWPGLEAIFKQKEPQSNFKYLKGKIKFK